MAAAGVEKNRNAPADFQRVSAKAEETRKKVWRPGWPSGCYFLSESLKVMGNSTTMPEAGNSPSA